VKTERVKENRGRGREGERERRRRRRREEKRGRGREGERKGGSSTHWADTPHQRHLNECKIPQSHQSRV
jgi:hypothetical protein